MKIKTSELQGAALDWAVAKCEGCAAADNIEEFLEDYLASADWNYCYSIDWSQGGPIMDRNNILVTDYTFVAGYSTQQYGCMVARKPETRQWGDTHLIAAMRCYVASKLGDEVDVPEELL